MSALNVSSWARAQAATKHVQQRAEIQRSIRNQLTIRAIKDSGKEKPLFKAIPAPKSLQSHSTELPHITWFSPPRAHYKAAAALRFPTTDELRKGCRGKKPLQKTPALLPALEKQASRNPYKHLPRKELTASETQLPHQETGRNATNSKYQSIHSNSRARPWGRTSVLPSLEATCWLISGPWWSHPTMGKASIYLPICLMPVGSGKQEGTFWGLLSMKGQRKKQFCTRHATYSRVHA